MPDPIIYALESRGQIAHQWIYTRAGDVRTYFKPAQPHTIAQGNTRTKFATVQRVITVMQPSTRADVRSIAANPPYWPAWLMKVTLGPKHAQWPIRLNEFANLTNPQQTAWDIAALLHGVDTVHVEYSDIGPIRPGLTLWVTARTLYNYGLNQSALTPGPTNAEDWASYVNSETYYNAITIDGEIITLNAQQLTIGT